MYSANTPDDLFDLFFTNNDYVRTDIDQATGVPRRSRYALVTTLRVTWNGHPGVRAWTKRGCGPTEPGLIVYDPEFRPEWTPPAEVEDLPASVRKAARLVDGTGCHRFGIAPGALPFFGLDPIACEVNLAEGAYRDLPWGSIDLVDIQSQRLLGDHCLPQGGLALYEQIVSRLAALFKEANPNIEVLTQVSFRDSAADTMTTAIARVAKDVDGIYFSYPTTNPDIPCAYCRPEELEVLLRYLDPQ
ncbi:MAG: hypothetical protein M3N53_11715 [Actinomycetota bacterium]|nr:hypothetical protein [Actinomycetota bacterium]